MPVILPNSALEAWLEPASRDRDLLEPDAVLELEPVSNLVNSVNNDGPALTAPALPS